MGHFYPFTPLTTQEIKILKKWKKHLEISCHTSVPKMKIICYTVLGIWHVMDVIFYFSFWVIFCPIAPLTPQKIKIKKKWKENAWIYHHFTRVPKIMIRWCTVPEIWWAADRWRDRQKKWHIEVGAPPKKRVQCSVSLWNLQKFKEHCIYRTPVVAASVAKTDQKKK